MPIYTFEHPVTEETKDVVLPISGPIEYEENGVKWRRVYEFNVAIKSSSYDPWSQKDYLRKTSEMKGTMGDMWDLSKEMSQKRAKDNGGVDPVKQKYEADYSKKRRGYKLPKED